MMLINMMLIIFWNLLKKQLADDFKDYGLVHEHIQMYMNSDEGNIIH